MLCAISITKRFSKHKIGLLTHIVSLLIILIPAFIFFTFSTPRGRLISNNEQCNWGKSLNSSFYRDNFIVKNPDEKLRVIEYFSPACSLCKEFHPKFKSTIKKFDKDVEFIYQPVLLRAQYIMLFNALYLATEEGKYLDLVDSIFADSTRLSRKKIYKMVKELRLGTKENINKIKNRYYDDKIYIHRKK